MCLGIPGQVIEVRDRVATVDFWGVKKAVKLDILETFVVAGDYVISHCGYAIRKIDPADVADTLGTYEIVLSEAGEDPIAAEIAAELEAEEVLV
jgi:hydrogenase expression/formation protein HypC